MRPVLITASHPCKGTHARLRVQCHTSYGTDTLQRYTSYGINTLQRHTSNGINTLQRHTSYGNKYTCFPGVNWAPTLKFKGLSYEYNKVPPVAWPVRLPARAGLAVLQRVESWDS